MRHPDPGVAFFFGDCGSMAFAEQMMRFREHLSSRGLKFTAQREAIAVAFFEAEGHSSLSELLERSRARHSSVGFATVYRTMKLLAECGLAAQHRFEDGQESRYEVASEGKHHDHLICVQCAVIVEFEDEGIERLQSAVAATHGFVVTSHRHEIYGMCPGCRSSSAAAGVSG